MGRADPGVGGRRRDPRAPGATLGRWASGLSCPLGETGERLGTVPVGPGDGDNGPRPRPGRGRSPLEVLLRVPQGPLLQPRGRGAAARRLKRDRPGNSENWVPG